MASTQTTERCWETGYDWRKAEAKLNSLPQFTTEIDGLQIHFNLLTAAAAADPLAVAAGGRP
jgi:hypothetical protein